MNPELNTIYRNDCVRVMKSWPENFVDTVITGPPYCNLTPTPTGGIVLDPFCGSGTTLWAAEYHNRPWIGIEMNPEYVAIAEARLARERSQLKMAV